MIELTEQQMQALAGVLVDSVVPSLAVDTVYADTIAQVLGRLSPTLLQKLDTCLKVGLGLP